jgi:PRTRC genetic system protein C
MEQIQITSAERLFKFQKDGEDMILNDPNEDMSADDVLRFYAGSYPELTTATISGPVFENDKMVYEFKTTLGTKG